MSENELINQLKAIIITKGREGSELIYKEANNQILRANISLYASEKKIIDTTGAGDGYRAGFLAGLLLNMTFLDSCRLGSIISSFVVETQGAQSQNYKLSEVQKRFLKNYSYIPQELKSLKA